MFKDTRGTSSTVGDPGRFYGIVRRRPRFSRVTALTYPIYESVVTGGSHGTSNSKSRSNCNGY